MRPVGGIDIGADVFAAPAIANRVVAPFATGVAWKTDVDSAAWDAALAALGGHPLQSALWGDARRAVDGIRDRRLIAFVDAKPVWMIRVEERRLPFGGWIGWAPRGPSGTIDDERGVLDHLAVQLRPEGMRLLVTDPWRESSARDAGTRSRKPRTIWVDLDRDEDEVWQSLHARIRQGVRRAERDGVVCTATHDREQIEEFVLLCQEVSRTKGFELGLSAPLAARLVARSKERDGEVTATLFAASLRGRFAAGVLAVRVNRSFHQLWSAASREFSRERAGEAVQWAAMKWAMDRGCGVYDLEGIDPAGNKGVYDFKTRLGGAEVDLVGKQYSFSSLVGRALAWAEARRG